VEKVNLERVKVLKEFNKIKHDFTELSEAFDKYRSTKDLSIFKKQRSTIESQMQTSLDKLKSIAGLTQPLQASFAELVSQIEKLFKDKLSRTKGWHEDVITFLTEASGSGGVDEKKKEALTTKLGAVEKAVAELDEKLDVFGDKLEA
jgi:hypothetical protein